MIFSPCVSCSNWKVISVSGSTFPTSLDPLCPASLSPFIHLGQMSTRSQPERDMTHSGWIEGKNVEGGAHSDLGSSNVTVQCVAIVLLSMIWSNSWCSLLGLVTTTYKPYTRLMTGIIKALDIHVWLCGSSALLSPRCGQQVSPAHQAYSRFPLSTAQTRSHWPKEENKVSLLAQMFTVWMFPIGSPLM